MGSLAEPQLRHGSRLIPRRAAGIPYRRPPPQAGQLVNDGTSPVRKGGAMGDGQHWHRRTHPEGSGGRYSFVARLLLMNVSVRRLDAPGAREPRRDAAAVRHPEVRPGSQVPRVAQRYCRAAVPAKRGCFPASKDPVLWQARSRTMHCDWRQESIRPAMIPTVQGHRPVSAPLACRKMSERQDRRVRSGRAAVSRRGVSRTQPVERRPCWRQAR